MIAYVAFPSLHASPLAIAARLSCPEGAGPHPAVIILHGAVGPSGREEGYAEALNAAGFLTLEPDLRSARGLGASAGPSVHQSLPDLFGARRFLVDRPEVDASRVGVLGFGAGGAAALLAATRTIDQCFSGEGAFPEDGCFAGFLAFYPVCHRFNRAPGFEFADLVAAPILIATAALDGYDDDPGAGPALVKSLPALDRMKVRTAVFHGVQHGFDVPGPRRQLEDSEAHRGGGGLVTMEFDEEAAVRAHGLAVQIFGEMRGRPARREPSRYAPG
jgi:dienelactone hydrolase